jgi:stearoyl-CoA desaturase (delta-9 desaturase)
MLDQPAAVTADSGARKPGLHWGVLAFIGGYHVALIVLLPVYLWHSTPSPGLLGLTFGLWCATLMAITTGYHRFYSHKTYRAARIMELPLLFFATVAIQGSALKWAFDHRLHHKHVDGEKDPYGTSKGFWHSHVLWMFEHQEPIEERVVRDLMANPLVMFQHRHYGLLATLANVLVVLVVALLTRDFLGAVVFGFLVRLFMAHHSTWFINSLAHIWGSKPYSSEHSAVNNFILAHLTFGEGYHNYHHTFSGDYRNGVRWYQFDPPKYLIWLMSKVGLASDLQRVNRVAIEKKLVAADRKLMLEHLDEFDHPRLQAIVESMESTYESLTDKLSQMKTDLDRYAVLKRDRAREEIRIKKAQIRELRRSIRVDMKEWQRMCNEVIRLKPAVVDA